MRPIIIVVLINLAAGSLVAASGHVRKAVSRSDVRVTGGFWLPRILTNATVTLKACWDLCESTGRIDNFRNCAKNSRSVGHKGVFYNDSDVYKLIEGAAYIYAGTRDSRLAGSVNGLIAAIETAQEPDGYLYTPRTLGGNANVDGTRRWEWLARSHELYCAGHMYEAAVAWYEASGETNLLAVARKNADLLVKTFGWGPGQLRLPPGHQEIELALCRLFRTTGDARYLELARFFLDIRGRHEGGETSDPSPFARWDAGKQAHLPVSQQDEAVGHAVRAVYMYCGMADVAVLTGDRARMEVVNRLWENVVFRKLHLTGGVGAGAVTRHRRWGEAREAFGEDYFLPNDSAYLETCAAVANILWNHRMFLVNGMSGYVDVLERALYNGFLSGVALSGDAFFYQNPLASKGGYRRSAWFETSCCPLNVLRLIPQIETFAYAEDASSVYVNLYLSSEARVGGLGLDVRTEYPYDGHVALSVTEAGEDARRVIKLRIPGWAYGRPLPGTLYRHVAPGLLRDVTLSVNGRPVAVQIGADGYVDIENEWRRGDRIDLRLPMRARTIMADDRVAANRGRLAVERGPLVFCCEGFDNPGDLERLSISSRSLFREGRVSVNGVSVPSIETSAGVRLIPYFAWDHRRPGNPMQVWSRNGGESPETRFQKGKNKK